MSARIIRANQVSEQERNVLALAIVGLSPDSKLREALNFMLHEWDCERSVIIYVSGPH